MHRRSLGESPDTRAAHGVRQIAIGLADRVHRAPVVDGGPGSARELKASDLAVVFDRRRDGDAQVGLLQRWRGQAGIVGIKADAQGTPGHTVLLGPGAQTAPDQVGPGGIEARIGAHPADGDQPAGIGRFEAGLRQPAAVAAEVPVALQALLLEHLDAAPVVGGRTVELAAERPREGLVRIEAQGHGDLHHRRVVHGQLVGGALQPQPLDIAPRRLTDAFGELAMEVEGRLAEGVGDLFQARAFIEHPLDLQRHRGEFIGSALHLRITPLGAFRPSASGPCCGRATSCASRGAGRSRGLPCRPRRSRRRA